MILHLRYTARDGGAAFRDTVEDELETALNTMLLTQGRKGLFRLLDMKREFPNEWYQLLHPSGDPDGQRLTFDLHKRHFPSQFQQHTLEIQRLMLFLQLKDPGVYENSRPAVLSITSPDGATVEAELQVIEDELGGLPHAVVDYGNAAKGLGTWALRATESNIAELPDELTVTDVAGGATHDRLNPEAVEGLGVLCHYRIESGEEGN